MVEIISNIICLCCAFLFAYYFSQRSERASLHEAEKNLKKNGNEYRKEYEIEEKERKQIKSICCAPFN